MATQSCACYDGQEVWHVNGTLHRDNDKPAIVRADGTREWWVTGKRHRDGDKPAIVEADGTLRWFWNGEPHRGGGGPATVHTDGWQEWGENGVLIKDAQVTNYDESSGRFVLLKTIINGI